MATVKELREQAAKAVTEARSLLDAISDTSTPEQRKEAEQSVDKALDEATQIEARADRMSKLEEAEKRTIESIDRAEREARESKRPGLPIAEAHQGGDMDYRTAFHEYVRAQGQKGDMSAEGRAVLDSGYQTVEHRAQTTTNAAGGFSIPEEMMQRVIVSMLATGPMYDPGVTGELETIGGNSMPFPTTDDTAKTAEVHTEGATLTDDGGKDIVFGEKQLDAFAYNTEWLRVSKELADDSFIAFETFIGRLLGLRLGRIANLQLTTGSGSGAPNGIVTASGLGVTATGTAAITFDEIMNLEHSVNSAYRRQPKVGYMMNDKTLLAVKKLKDGDGNYLWQQGNVQAGTPGMLNGRNYIINDDMAELGAGAKVMLFGDMEQYIVRKVGQPLIGAIQDKDFWPGFGIAGYIRFDGELADVAAVKHLITAAS